MIQTDLAYFLPYSGFNNRVTKNFLRQYGSCADKTVHAVQMDNTGQQDNTVWNSAFSSEKKYKGIFSYCSTTKNLKLFRRSHLQKFHKKLVVLKISKNPQKIKYIAITDVKKLILILLECYNSVLLENELLNRYLAKNLYRFSKPLFSRTPDVGVVRLRGVIKMCFVPRLIKL